MRQIGRSVSRGVEFRTGKFRTLETKVVAAFADAGIRLASAVNKLTFSLKRTAALAGDSVPVKFLLQHFRPGRVVFDLVGGAVTAIAPARRDQGDITFCFHLINLLCVRTASNDYPASIAP